MLVHLYGVVGADVELPGEQTGRADAPIRTIGDDRLKVLVSDVDDDARVGRDDLLVHAHLLEELAREITVVPMQFGMLMPDDDAVRHEVLGNQGERLAGLLHAFAGLVQLTVTAEYDEDAALGAVVARDPSLRGQQSADLEARLRLGEAVAAGLDDLRQEDADLVLERLGRHARAAALNELRGAYDVVSVALLVERERRTELDRSVAELGQEVAPRMRLRYVGPQPPYAFLDSVSTGEPTWA